MRKEKHYRVFAESDEEKMMRTGTAEKISNKNLIQILRKDVAEGDLHVVWIKINGKLVFGKLKKRNKK